MMGLEYFSNQLLYVPISFVCERSEDSGETAQMLFLQALKSHHGSSMQDIYLPKYYVLAHMGLDAGKQVFGGLRTIKAHTSLRIPAV